MVNVRVADFTPLASPARVFAQRFGIPAATLRYWEQGRRTPDPAARVLLRVIARDRNAVLRVLNGT
jgi:putative transcriptional regulator